MELSVGGIIESSSVHTKALLEPGGDKRTQVDGVQS